MADACLGCAGCSPVDVWCCDGFLIWDTLAGIIVAVSFRTICHSIKKKMCIDQGASFLSGLCSVFLFCLFFCNITVEQKDPSVAPKCSNLFLWWQQLFLSVLFEVVSCIKPSAHSFFRQPCWCLYIQKVIFNVCIITVATFQPCSVVVEKLQAPYAVAWRWLLSQSSNYLKAVCARNVSEKLFLKSALWPRNVKNGNKFEKLQGERK